MPENISNSILYEYIIKLKKKEFGEECVKYDPTFVYEKKSSWMFTDSITSHPSVVTVYFFSEYILFFVFKYKSVGNDLMFLT